MTKEKTYNTIVEWLYPIVRAKYEGSDIEKYAHGGHKPLKGIISSLWSLFDDAVTADKGRRFRWSDKTLYVFNGEYFEASSKDFIEEVILRILVRLDVSAAYRLAAPAQIAQQCIKRISCSDVYSYIPDRRYICFTNGVFDVKDGKLKPFKVDYCTDLILDFEYHTQAELDVIAAKDGGHTWHTNYSKLWFRKLDEIIPNKELQGDFQQFCGSLILDRNEIKSEYICYLTSTGANGKSTIASAVANVFGEEYYTTFSPHEIFGQGTNSQFVINELAGKILNLCDDMDSSRSFAGGRMKGFVSGEKLTGRGLYSSEFKKVQPPMMLCCTNDFAYVDDDSWGHHRRQMIITCTNDIPAEIDRELGLKLRTDVARNQIFLWIYKGAKRVMSQKGIELSDACRAAMLNRRANSSPMRIWATDMCYMSVKPIDNADPRWYKLVDLYGLYRQYCVSNGYKYEADARKVSAMFVSMGCEKKNLNGQGTALCVGRLGIDTNEDGRLINE